MARSATIQRVDARRATTKRVGHAEIYSIGPRKAVMEFLEARSTIRRDKALLGPRSSTRHRRETAA